MIWCFGFDFLNCMLAREQAAKPLNTYIAVQKIIQTKNQSGGEIDEVHRDRYRGSVPGLQVIAKEYEARGGGAMKSTCRAAGSGNQ